MKKKEYYQVVKQGMMYVLIVTDKLGAVQMRRYFNSLGAMEAYLDANRHLEEVHANFGKPEVADDERKLKYPERPRYL